MRPRPVRTDKFVLNGNSHRAHAIFRVSEQADDPLGFLYGQVETGCRETLYQRHPDRGFTHARVVDSFEPEELCRVCATMLYRMPAWTAAA